MFKKNEEAVSPVIAVILLVAITVILAAVIAAFSMGFAGTPSKGPTAGITVSNFPETASIMDMKIQHKVGDKLVGGDWQISIVPVGQAPVYRKSDLNSDFKAGDVIITKNLTIGNGNYNVTNNSITTDSLPAASVELINGGKYDVKIVVYPFNTMVLDTVVEIR